jgi:hypothetical protein
MRHLLIAIPIFLLVFLLAACGQSPSPVLINTAVGTAISIPASTSTPLATTEVTPDSNLYVAWDGSFSLKAPAGWQIKDLGLKYLSLEGPLVANRSAKLDFIGGGTAQPPGEYASYAQEQLRQQLPEPSEFDEQLQETAVGAGYLRWEIEYNRFNEDIHQVFYFFELGDQVLTVIFTRLVEMGTETDVLIDAAVQTLSFGEDQ